MPPVRVLGVVEIGLPAPARLELVVDEGQETPAETLAVPAGIPRTRPALRAWLLDVLDLADAELVWSDRIGVPGEARESLVDRAKARKEKRAREQPGKPARR